MNNDDFMVNLINGEYNDEFKKNYFMKFCYKKVFY